MNRPVTNLKQISELIDAELVPAEQRSILEDVARRYAVSIPHSVAARIDPNDPNDPLARQFVPTPQENKRDPQERDDPIGDDLKSPVPGIVHRYADRALLKLVNICPIYCRFCFRRETIGPPASTNITSPKPATLSERDLDAALDYLRHTEQIWEVIITGGDPLVASPRRIRALNAALSEIPHIKIVRWHTRVPAILPHHITPDLSDALRCEGKTVYIGLHTNHPSEFTDEARKACARLIDTGHTMVSQTVLLKGINDNAATLIQLMRTLVENRIKPYYLHHTDLAPGTGQFRVSIERGQEIVREMRARLSGLAQPTYVLDIPGAHGKVPIGPSFITSAHDNSDAATHVLTDAQGQDHHYRDISRNPPVPGDGFPHTDNGSQGR